MGRDVFCPLSKICRCRGQNSGGFSAGRAVCAAGQKGIKKYP